MAEELLTEDMKQAVLKGFKTAAFKKAKAQPAADKLLAGLRFLQLQGDFNSFSYGVQSVNADAPIVIGTSLNEYETGKPIAIKVYEHGIVFNGKMLDFSDRSINYILTVVAERAEYQGQGQAKKKPEPFRPAAFMHAG